jgi:hypothetical protein
MPRMVMAAGIWYLHEKTHGQSAIPDQRHLPLEAIMVRANQLPKLVFKAPISKMVTSKHIS